MLSETTNGDPSVPFYTELANGGIAALNISRAFSRGELLCRAGVFRLTAENPGGMIAKKVLPPQYFPTWAVSSAGRAVDS
jgi:hypothetical protein